MNITNVNIKIIKQNLNVDDNNLKVFVLEKESPCHNEKSNNYKDGIHLIVPLPIHVDMRYFIREELIKNAKKEGWFDDSPIINQINDAFDNCAIMRNPSMMYGSKKKGGKKYDITYVYDGNGNKTVISSYEHHDKIIACSVRQFKEKDKLSSKIIL